jgi:hypothetical protein
MQFTALVSLLAIIAPLVSAHSFFTQIHGANGKIGVGFGSGGVDMHKGHNAFYHAPRWLPKAMPQYKVCGVNRRKSPADTRSYGIDWKSELKTAIKKGLPTTDKNGRIKLTLYQLNKDGAGPYSCFVSADASGRSWQRMSIVGANVPGNARGESNQVNRDHPLQIQLPKGVKCKGPGGACLVQCKNVNLNSFGGCIAIAGSGPTKRDLHGRMVEEEEETFLLD